MRAVVFDLDGTLIHSAPDIHAAANRMLADIGQAPLSLQTVTSFIGNGIPKLVERVMDARGLDTARHADLVAVFSRYYDADPATLTRLYPGVAQVLDRFGSLGLPMAVCTNKPEGPTRAILAALGVDGAFAAVIGGDSLPVKKPDPAPLLRAAEALGQPRTLYVGDSEIDAETAQRAGMPFALFSGGYRKSPVEALPHDALFDEFADLPAILDRLLPVAA